MKQQLEVTEKTKVRRSPNRGNYDQEVIYEILDEGKVCYVAFTYQNQPVVIPTAYGRKGNQVYIHGAQASRMMLELEKGLDMCLNVTHVDGLVLARSAFHHSMNYRSVVIFDKARLIEDFEEKKEALKVITNHLVPDRWDECREITKNEIEGTKVLAVSIGEASAKIRTGGPKDAKADYELPIWAGVIPCQLHYGDPIPDEENLPESEKPESLKHFYS